MTTEAADAADASIAAPARPRPVRRAPSALPFSFADRALIERLGTERGEPAWLRAERMAAADVFDALPIESNRLYTTYLDLRLVDLMTVVPAARELRRTT